MSRSSARRPSHRMGLSANFASVQAEKTKNAESPFRSSVQACTASPFPKQMPPERSSSLSPRTPVFRSIKEAMQIPVHDTFGMGFLAVLPILG